MAEFFVNLPTCLIGMEACGSAHYRARKLQAMGHTVKLMAPQFIKPYVKTNKHDAADAEAICEAVRRPNMRFVPIKNVEQQAVLALHRVRQGWIKARTAQVNQIRGLLSEFGLIVPQGIGHITSRVPAILDASVGDAKNFANGRQLAAWLGLVPKQHSSGGKTNLQGISKRGDTCLRTLLIHGARAVIRQIERKANVQGWLSNLLGRRNKNIATAALANKNARIAWALLAHDRNFRSDYVAA
jgi:transposase